MPLEPSRRPRNRRSNYVASAFRKKLRPVKQVCLYVHVCVDYLPICACNCICADFTMHLCACNCTYACFLLHLCVFFCIMPTKKIKGNWIHGNFATEKTTQTYPRSKKMVGRQRRISLALCLSWQRNAIVFCSSLLKSL